MNWSAANRVARCASALIALLAFAPLVHGQNLAPRLRSLQSRLDLGSASPGNGGAARATLSILVSSPSPWSLSVVLADGPASFDTLDRGLRLRDQTGNWVTLTRGTAAPIAAGASTPSAGEVLTFAIEFAPTWDQAPGDRAADLRFIFDNGAATENVRVNSRVEPTTTLESTPLDYALNVPDPSRPGLIPFDKAMYRVTSNVPWRATAKLDDVPRVVGGSLALRDDSLAVKVDGTTWIPVPVGNAAVTFTTGSPTGATGAPLQVEFALRVKASEVGGKYSAPLEIAAEPLATPSPK